jgi:hypothetical protein
LTQPASQTVTIGASASFTVAAGGTPTLSYQWQFNGTNIGGATSSVLTLTNVGFAQVGQYSVVITNAYGSTSGGPAVLTVLDTIPPTITACASDRTLSAVAECSALLPDLSGEVVASDASGSVTVTQNPPAGALLGLGVTNVTFTVRDSSSNAASCRCTITVVDLTPPVLVCPGRTVLEFQDEKGAVATYGVTATDVCSAVTLLATPPSGSVFPIGATPVHV